MQVPNVPDAGGPTRSYYFLKTLAEESDVTLVCLSAGKTVGPELAELCEHIIEPRSSADKTKPNKSASQGKLARLLTLSGVIFLPWLSHWHHFLLYFVQYTIDQPKNASPGLAKRLFRDYLKFWYQIAARWGNMPPMTAFMYEPSFQEAWPELVQICAEHDFDIVWCEHSTMHPYLKRVQKIAKAPVTICNSHNVETLLQQRYEDQAEAGWVSRYQQLQTSIYRRMEIDCYGNSDLVFTCSEDDSEAGRKLAPAGNFQVVGNGVDTEYFRASPDVSLNSAPTVVYTGGFGYPPNQDAVCHFIKEILPLIWKSRPDCEFLFAGFEAEQMWRQLSPQDKRIKYACSPKDIRPCFEQAWVFVVPIRIGGGTRLKVLEAMSMEKAIVSTTLGAEGIPCEPGKHLIHADRSPEFAEHVVQLLENEASRQKMGRDARQWVRERYDWRILCDAIRTELQPFLK